MNTTAEFSSQTLQMCMVIQPPFEIDGVYIVINEPNEVEKCLITITIEKTGNGYNYKLTTVPGHQQEKFPQSPMITDTLYEAGNDSEHPANE